MTTSIALLCLLSADALAATAFTGATLHPVSQPPIDDGVLLVADDGTIAAVGPAAEVGIPADATVVDLSGKVIIPGLVDTHSHIGGGRLHEHLGIVQPAISAIDAIDPSHHSIRRAQAGGITTVNVMPGSGRLMGGQTAYLKLRDASTVDDMLLCRDPAPPLLVPDADTDEATAGPVRWGPGICGGMKMANGTNPQGGPGAPASRMGSTHLQRETLEKGRERLAALEGAGERPRWFKPRRPVPRPEPEADALAQIAAGQRVVHFHTHRADDIITILKLRETYGFKVVLHHVSEAWKVAEPIAEAGVACSLIIIDSPGGKEEALEIRAENAAVLEQLGVTVALHTDDPITDSRLFLRSAGLAVRAGMTEAGALRALTLSGAEMMGLDERVGSLEAGKDADFVVLSGPPMSTWTAIEQTWVEGERVFDRADPDDARLATGGDDAPMPAGVTP